MSQKLKKIEITLPQPLIDEAIEMAEILEDNLDCLIEKSLRAYVARCRKVNINELKNGYGEAAEFNLSYAEMCLCADNQALTVCEEKLSESE